MFKCVCVCVCVRVCAHVGGCDSVCLYIFCYTYKYVQVIFYMKYTYLKHILYQLMTLHLSISDTLT